MFFMLLQHMKLLYNLIIFFKIDYLLPEVVKDKHPASLVAHLIPFNKLYAKPTIRKVVRNGINFTLDISDYMQWVVYFGHAAEDRNSLYKLVDDKVSVTFDIGGNIGETALNFARLSNGRVYTFEPNKETYKSLIYNIESNSNPNVIPVEKGLSNKPSKMKIKNRTVHNLGADQLTEIQKDERDEGVEVTTLDNFVRENDVKRMDLVKIDVEGMELFVLEGGENSIRKFKPVLYIEYSPDNFSDFGYSGNKLIEFINSIGYRLFSSQGKTEIKTDSDVDRQVDVIAIPN